MVIGANVAENPPYNLFFAPQSKSMNLESFFSFLFFYYADSLGNFPFSEYPARFNVREAFTMPTSLPPPPGLRFKVYSIPVHSVTLF